MRSPKASSMILPTLAPTSMPTSSVSLIGPTGKPQSSMAESIFSIGTPSATRCAASFIIGREYAARVEPDAIPHDDDVLALSLAEVDAGRGDPVGRLVGDDDLEQRHFVDR